MVAPVLLIGLLLVVNFARGMAENSAGALLWARVTLEIGGILLLGTACSPTHAMLAMFRRALLTAGVLIAGLTFLRLVFGPQLFMTIGTVDEVIGVNDGNRPLQVTGALMLGMGTTLLCSELIRKGLNRGWPQAGLLLVLLAALFASGHGHRRTRHPHHAAARDRVRTRRIPAGPRFAGDRGTRGVGDPLHRQRPGHGESAGRQLEPGEARRHL